jgi:hypothetical protein
MNEIPSDKENVKLLWTGGWDSTFQLLQLLITHRRRVTPFYIIDAERRSTGTELLTMKNIKDHLWNEYPYTRRLLQPTRYGAVEDVPPDSKIKAAYQAILKEKHIGSQYDWLARFCKENGLANMQICILHSRENPGHFSIRQFLSEYTYDSQTVFCVNPRFKETNEYVLFHYFSFPLIGISKVQMARLAEQRGWKRIMRMTWFCHKPTRNMKPCGKCSPCLQAIQEGLGWRITVRSRMVSFSYRLVIRPLKSLMKNILRQLGLLKYIRKMA